MVKTKHRTSDVIRRVKVPTSAIVGFQKSHEKNVEKKCVANRKKGASLARVFR